MLVLIASLAALFLAEADVPREQPIAGYWEGALTIEGSPLGIAVTIEETAEGFRAHPVISEWIWYAIEPSPVTKTETGIVIADLYGGDAVLTLDPLYGQLVGAIATPDGSIGVHLKPLPPPPRPDWREEEVTFTSDDGTRIAGTLTIPNAPEKAAAIILLHGRGCGRRSVGEARVYAARGMAALTFDKRGAGESSGDCSAATHAQTVADAEAAQRFLQRHRNIDRRRIGYRGTSAGAWTAQALAEKALTRRGLNKPAFLITWIGPATSIRTQQMASARTYGERVGATDEQIALAEEAVALITDQDTADPRVLERLIAIRAQAEREGWYTLMFGPDDLPQTEADVSTLYLKKFRFDPGPVLQDLRDTPYLAVFGAEDGIVPLDDNAAALDRAFSSSPSLNVVVLPNRGHSLEHGDQIVELPGGGTYFKVDTVEPRFMTETILFLQREGFMPR
ncbi:MAG: alpha/beta fold hydrolase [Pseudomonadota bacterium]